jgi:hypothetical protein
MGRKASFLANSLAIDKKKQRSEPPETALSQATGSYAGHPTGRLNYVQWLSKAISACRSVT